MKAISLRQPWADWVVQGKKSLELRTWTVSYRGPVAIHASQTVNREVCLANGIDPDSLTLGGVVGSVVLVDIIDVDADRFQANQSRHMAQGMFDEPKNGEKLYGWVLENARELSDPIPYHGRMGLFNIPDQLLTLNSQPVMPTPIKLASPNLDTTVTKVAIVEKAWDERSPFELRVIPESAHAPAQAAYRLAVFQRIIEPPPAQQRLTINAPVQMRLVSEVRGSLLKSVADQVLETLRRNDYKVTDLSAGRREPFALNEESGVRLGLLFMAIRPVTKMNRVESMSQGIRAMTSEELYYWFSKCTSKSAERAQKALRILLSEE